MGKLTISKEIPHFCLDCMAEQSLLLRLRQPMNPFSPSSSSLSSSSSSSSSLFPMPSRTTLIVCPASILHQWQEEVTKHTIPGALRVCTYHGIKDAFASVKYLHRHRKEEKTESKK